MKFRALILGLLIAALGGCNKSNPLPDQPTDDPSSRTTTAFNPPSSPQEMAEKCDVPYYPSAKAPDGLSRLPKKDTDGNTHYELVLTTNDSPKTVAAFYSKALKLPTTTISGALSLVGKSPHKNDLIIEVVSEGGQTVIRIHSIGYKSA